MERLVTTNEAAQLLGLSLQGVHYRIKKNQLRTKKEDGKLYVYINDYMRQNPNNQAKPINTTNDDNQSKEYFEKVLSSKDEQIELLKATVTWMKKQYKSEIARLEKNQKRIIKVFDSEIKLLQSAFNEMRNIYKIENKELSKNKKEEYDYPELLDIKEFYKLMKTYKKTDMEIKLIILDRIKKSDKRFIFNKATKEILIQKSDFLDLI